MRKLVSAHARQTFKRKGLRGRFYLITLYTPAQQSSPLVQPEMDLCSCERYWLACKGQSSSEVGCGTQLQSWTGRTGWGVYTTLLVWSCTIIVCCRCLYSPLVFQLLHFYPSQVLFHNPYKNGWLQSRDAVQQSVLCSTSCSICTQGTCLLLLSLLTSSAISLYLVSPFLFSHCDQQRVCG